MNCNPTVSVLMPVYNGYRYVSEAIESILQQTYTDFELLITDDGSQDQSLTVLQSYAERDARILLTSRSNKGLTPTMNEMLGKARGKFIAVMEQDDCSIPQRLALETQFLQEHPDVVCVSGWPQLIDEEGRLLTQLMMPTTHNEIQTLALAGHSGVSHPGVMFRKDSLLQVGGYDESLRLAHDLDLWLKLGEVGKLANLAEGVVQYRLHPESESERNRLRQREEALIVCQRAWQRRGIDKGQFDAHEPWRPGSDKASRHYFMLKYGWWAFRSGERQTALLYGWRAVRTLPIDRDGWRLILCSLVKPVPKSASS